VPVLVIASTNPAKLRELDQLFDPLDLELRPMPADLVIEETGSTYAANARLKASTVARLCGHWSLGDDSGLEVDALEGAPGLYSARWAADDASRCRRLLEALADHPYRSARFRSAVALAAPDGSIRLESEGECRGEILRAPRGPGRGYDSLFWVREAGCTHAAMTDEQRSRLGSRGKALRRIADAVRRELGLRPPC
jgi:non-canonical purine NTP pyrophosphatase (RdgB/HAM1 family)